MRKFLIELILAIITKATSKKYKEGAGPGKLEQRLRNKLKKDGWKNG